LFVLGTAGHVDHGKSALVQALTGIDPDRLSQEKERGMTIDLGFAWLKLPSGQEIGIVDVPGHERFVRNMLAGAGGIDIAMLVIAANEGVMPQTREHLAILDLLGISKGLVALTKKDLVDKDWLDLVRLDIEELLKTTTLSGSPIVPVSAITREGLPELLDIIDKLLANTPAKKDKGKPRLPIDRIFTISGSGTVVTGTLIDGSLSAGQEVEIVPGGLKSRLRGLQTHKSGVSKVLPGTRVAANLTGITTTQLQRGDILTKPGWLVPTTLVCAKLLILKDAKQPLKHNIERNFYVLAAEASVKVRLLEAEAIKPSESGWVQLMLDRPLAIVDGDHFIIRSTTETLGGGVIVDAHARRMPRFKPEVIEALNIKEKGSPEELIHARLDENKWLELADLLTQIALPATEVKVLAEWLGARGEILQLGQGEHGVLVSLDAWNNLSQDVKQALQEYHNRFPARTGIPKVELLNKLKLGKYSQLFLDRLVSCKLLIDEGIVVRLPEFQVKLSEIQQAKIDTFLKALTEKPYAPPTELIPELELLNLLIERKQAVKLNGGVVVSTKAYSEMVGKILAYLTGNGKITLAEVRDMFQTSRKYAQALMEHLDAEKVTRRVGDERVKY
jgi:selenocysteine-specific elongation factor